MLRFLVDPQRLLMRTVDSARLLISEVAMKLLVLTMGLLCQVDPQFQTSRHAGCPFSRPRPKTRHGE